MARIYVSAGSNIDRARNIRLGMKKLHAKYAPLTVSSIYDSEPVGFEGDCFFNLVVGFGTGDSPQEVVETLHVIEDQCQRTRDGIRFSARTLDLDLLLYDDRVIEEPGISLPRREILRYAFVLGPLAEIAGERHHPIERSTFARLWAEFDKSEQRIWIVPYELGLPKEP